MKMSRLLKKMAIDLSVTALAGLTAASINFSASKPIEPKSQSRLETLVESGTNFPYDINYFEAAERVVFPSSNKISINIIPKQGESLDLRLHYQSSRAIIQSSTSVQAGLASMSSTISKDEKSRRINMYFPQLDQIAWSEDTSTVTYSGVNDSLDIELGVEQQPNFSYWLAYKKSNESTWKMTPERDVITPYKKAYDKNSKIVVLFTSDEHTYDDADLGSTVVTDPKLRELRLNGDYVNYFLNEIIKDPSYYPRDEWSYLKEGYCFARAMFYIWKYEKPDIIFTLGDSRLGAGHKWAGLGLKDQWSATPEEIDQYEKIFTLRLRKMWSALTPTVPVYFVFGNHDGEAGFNQMIEPATRYMKKYWKQPSVTIDSITNDENYFAVDWGITKPILRPIPLMSTSSQESQAYQDKFINKVRFIVTDVMRYNSFLPLKPEDWTLGSKQKVWLKTTLEANEAEQTNKTENTFILFHHALGGWPAGSGEDNISYAYGRGMLFTPDDYAKIPSINPSRIEQIEITRLAQKNNVRGFIYGHDHIYKAKKIGADSEGKDVFAICAGSTKYEGEFPWWRGLFWRLSYGNYESGDFWGPSGITKLIIEPAGITSQYVRTADNTWTNIPETIRIGDIVQENYLISIR